MRIRLVGGCCDGKVWEGGLDQLEGAIRKAALRTPPVSVTSGWARDPAPPRVVQSEVVYSYYKLHTFHADADVVHVYGEESMSARQVLDALLTNYFPPDWRVEP